MGFFQKIVQGIKKTKDAFSKKLFFAFSARELDDEWAYSSRGFVYRLIGD